MDLCIVNDCPQADLLKTGRNGVLFVCFDWRTKQKLKEKGLKAVAYDEFISEKDGDTADKFVFQLSKKWYLDRGRDITLFDGISLGRAWEWVTWWETLIPAYKFIVAMDSLIKKERPKMVYCHRSEALRFWGRRSKGSRSAHRIHCGLEFVSEKPFSQYCDKRL